VSDLNPQIVSQTALTITIKWTPLPDCGYRFSVDRVVKSHTWDETRSSARFSKPQDGLPHEYGVEPITIGTREYVTA
jgi:hypothetical protein